MSTREIPIFGRLWECMKDMILRRPAARQKGRCVYAAAEAAILEICSYEMKRIDLCCVTETENEQETYMLIMEERTDILVVFC